MAAKVLAAISHKGGTGRSVTVANVAYQMLRNMKQSVLIVDLDLASPTMGSIFAVQGYEAGAKTTGVPGAPKSVHDLLVHGDTPTFAMVLDLKDSLKGAFGKGASTGKFGLIPGYAPGGDNVREQKLGSSLKRILEPLKRDFNYDWVILDIRSGISDVMEALTDTQHGCAGVLDLVLVHFRWTRQHLAGLESLLSDSHRLGAMPENKVALVRTAFSEPDHKDPLVKTFMTDEHAILKQKFRQISFKGKTLTDDSLLGSIPLDARLRWQEGVLWGYEKDDPSVPTITAYAQLADRIRARVNP